MVYCIILRYIRFDKLISKTVAGVLDQGQFRRAYRFPALQPFAVSHRVIQFVPGQRIAAPDFPKHSGFQLIWGFPKTRGTFLGIPIIRTIVF